MISVYIPRLLIKKELVIGIEEWTQTMDSFLKCPIIKAIREDDLSAVQECVDQGRLLVRFAATGMEVLHYAALQGCSEPVLKLLLENCNPRSRDRCSQTPLFYAVAAGQIRVAKQLAEELKIFYKDEKNCFYLECNNLGANPLHLASKVGNLEMVRLLLLLPENGKPSEVKEQKTLLLNAQDKFGCTPLHYAAQEGHDSIVLYLLEQRARITLKNSKGFTAYDLAKNAGALDVSVESLLNPELSLKNACSLYIIRNFEQYKNKIEKLPTDLISYVKVRSI